MLSSHPSNREILSNRPKEMFEQFLEQSHRRSKQMSSSLLKLPRRSSQPWLTHLGFLPKSAALTVELQGHTSSLDQYNFSRKLPGGIKEQAMGER
jgi:hypothetical protein